MKERDENIDRLTIGDFGRQWSVYTENTGYYGSTECLADILGPLASLSCIRDKQVGDIGSGSGRIVNMLLDAGAQRVVAVEPSDAFYTLQANVQNRRDRVTFIHDKGEAIESEADLHFILSIGVLHHIKDPRPVVRAAKRALKSGGRMLVWVYGFEGNEVYLRVIGPLRTLTSRLPHFFLSVLASGINVILGLYILLGKIVPLPMGDYLKNHLQKLDRSQRKLTIYDQLNPAYAKYYKEKEARALLEDEGFIEVAVYHRHGYSWTITGTKPNE